MSTRTFTAGDDVFEVTCDMINVTSLHRPAIGWIYTDKNGHVHQWFEGDSPATSYNPTARYTVPSLVWVKDGEEYWEGDDEPHDVGHNECRQCGEHIVPHYTADESEQYIPGMRRFSINGESVTPEEFERRITPLMPKRNEP